VRSEGFYVNEKSNPLAGIKPATFRFVARHLNHCATAEKCVCSLRYQHAKCMRRVILSFVASPALQHVPTLSHTQHDLREKIY